MMNDFVGKQMTYPITSLKRNIEGGLRLIRDNTPKKIPLVSIVTVVYNAKNVLESTIQSVLNQTYCNIEYIIIDGKSTDGSLEIIENYADKIEYFISEQDNGIYHAMNKGISLAQGDFICLLNAGDYYNNDFIEKSVETALKSNADIVYSAIHWGGINRYPPKMINSGILLHHLNINHMTFLVSKDTYKKMGLYNENFRLFSDDIWTRKAYQKGVNFVYLPELLVEFSEGGLSQGDTEEKREAIVSESGIILRRVFPFLTIDESEQLYLTRFRISSVFFLLEIYNRYAVDEPLFKEALSHYIAFLLQYREAFIFSLGKSNEYLSAYTELAIKLDIPFTVFKFYRNMNIGHVFDAIKKVRYELRNTEANSQTRILHFVSLFSSPSETFIYDLILRMEQDQTKKNIVLCDKRVLADIRPYASCIEVDWEATPPIIREWLYWYIFNTIHPNVIIAHFALNGWKLYQRMASFDKKFPMINMMHGIDVFSMSEKDDYRQFILNKASIDPSIVFTSVSNYLLGEAVERGVPEEKISLIPNVVHDRFFKYRKNSNFYDGLRNLEVLNVG